MRRRRCPFCPGIARCSSPSRGRADGPAVRVASPVRSTRWPAKPPQGDQHEADPRGEPTPAAAKPAAGRRTRTATVVVLPVEPVAEAIAEVIALAAPRPRRRSRATRAVVPVALGSLTQPGARTGDACCERCGSDRRHQPRADAHRRDPGAVHPLPRLRAPQLARAAGASSTAPPSWSAPARSADAARGAAGGPPLGSPHAVDQPPRPADLDRISRRTTCAASVPDQLDEALAHDVGAAFVALVVGAAGGTGRRRPRHAPEQPAAGRRVRRGRDRRRAPTSCRSGWPRPTRSTSPRAASTRPGAMFTASHNPAQYNGIKLCRPAPRRSAQDTGLAEITRTLVEAGVPPYDGPAGTVVAARPARRVRGLPAGLVDLSGDPAADASSSTPATAWPATPRRSCSTGLPLTVVPLYFELDGTFPNHEANPIEPENLRDLQARGARETAPTSGWPSTATPTAASSSTSAARSSSPSTLTALIAVARAGPRARRDGHPQPDHARAPCPRSSREHGGTPGAHPGRALVHQAGDGRDRRGLRRRALRPLLLPRLLARRLRDARRAARRSPRWASTPAGTTLSSCSRRTTATSRPARSTPTVARPRRGGWPRSRPRSPARDGADRRPPRRPDGRRAHDWWFNLRASNTEPLLRLNVEADDGPTMDAVRDRVLAIVREGA